MKRYQQVLAGILFVLSSGSSMQAQNLSAAAFQSFEQLGNSQAHWVDVDGDGWLDLYLTGKDALGNTKARLYQNNRNESFTEYAINLPATSSSQLHWTDVDGDGLQDVLMIGQKADGSRISQLYKNKGARNFELWHSFPYLSSGGARWADFNSDGSQDLLLWGIDGSGSVLTKLYARQEESWVEQSHNLPSLYRADVNLLDYDLDGRPDVLLSGLDALGRRLSGLYRQDGDFRFSDTNLAFSQLSTPILATGDLNADGRPDVVMSGLDESSTSVTHIYLNDGAAFQKLPFEPAGISNGSLSLGDLNNDGLPDILLAGYTNSSIYETYYYENRGNNTFQEEALGLEAVGRGSLALGDFNNDHSLDLFLTGNRNGSLPPIAKLYENITAPANSAPEAPAGLQALTTHDRLQLSWNAATDNGQTAAAGLSYRLYIGTAPGLQDVYFSNSLLSGSSARAGLGNLQQSAGLALEGLPEGRYFWSVQAVDNSYVTSAFAAEQSIVVCHDIFIGEDLTICPEEPLQFRFEAPGDQVNWYSTQQGALGSGASLEFSTAQTDTLVVEVVRALGCTRYDSLVVNVLPQPSLNLGPDLQLCMGELLELNVGESYDSVNWFLPNGTSLAEDSPALSYSIETDVSLIAEVWNEAGCAYYDTLFVKALALPTVNLGADQAICSGDLLTLDVGTGYEEVNWFLPNGTSLGNDPVLNLEGLVDSEIIVEVFNAAHCVQYDTLQMTVLPRPGVSLGADREVCMNDTLNLDVGESYARVNWFLQDGSLLAEGSPVLNFPVKENFSLVVEVFNEEECPAYDTLNITSLARPQVNLGEDRNVCSGDFIELDAGEGYANVNWFLADGTLLQDSTQTLSYQITEDVALVAEVWNELGCPNYDTLTAYVLDRPLAILGDDRRICLGETLHLDAGEGHEAVNWFLADGTLVLEDSRTLDWVVAENDSLVVEVINTQGCPAYDTLFVEALPLPEISLGADQGICHGDSIYLNAGEGYTTVNWYLVNGILLSENTPAFQYRILEDVELVVEVFDGESCRNLDTLRVQSLARPLIDLGPDQEACYGSELLLSLPDTYTKIGWYTLSGDTLAQDVFGLDYTVWATDTLRVEVFNEAGCPSADTLIIRMNELPVADAGPDQVFCVGSSPRLGGEYAATEGLQFRWEPAVYLDNPGVLHPLATVQETTTFYLTVTNSNGCIQRDSLTLHQDSPSQVNPGADRYICLGESTQLGGEPTATGSTFAYSYEWSPTYSLDDAASPNPMASPMETTTYQLISRTGECVVDTAWVTIEVKPLPVITLTEDLSLGFGESTLLQASGGETYYWYPQTGLDNYSIPNPVAAPAKTTEYHVVVTDSLGCQNEASVMVYVKNDLYIPNTFTPNGDGQNDTFMVYGNGVQEISLSIYNRWGKLIYQTTEVEAAMSRGWNGTVNGEIQETGIYQWSIKGRHFDGSPLQFKGNQTGTFKLIR
jgi:gliding motility-associated-like protein